MFSRSPCIMRMLCTSKKMSHFSHDRRGFSPVVCRQLSLPPTNCSLLLGYVFFLPIVGRWSDSSRDCRWVFGLWVFSPCWLDDQLVNALARCFVGVLRPPFLSLCVSVCCLIHGNPVKHMAHEFSPCSCYPAFLFCACLCVCVGGGGGGEGGDGRE